LIFIIVALVWLSSVGAGILYNLFG